MLASLASHTLRRERKGLAAANELLLRDAIIEQRS